MAELHVVSALVVKRGELAGQAQLCHQELQRLAAELGHLDATIRLFAPAYDLGAIRPRKRREPGGAAAPDRKGRGAGGRVGWRRAGLGAGVRGSGRQTLRAPGVALPIAAPVAMRAGAGTLGEDVGEDFPVGPAPGVLAIGRLVGVVGEVGQAEVVVLADLHPPKAREQRLRLVLRRYAPGGVQGARPDMTGRDATRRRRPFSSRPSC